MKRADLEAILPIARQAAHEAGVLVRRGFRSRPTVEHKGVVDLVTRFDRESETLVRARLAAALPFAVIGEEEGGTWDAAAPTFFVDPLDGTTNFVHGHPFWCVSIGLVEDGECVLGVVVSPMLGLEWHGFVADGGEREAMRRAIGNARTDGGAGIERIDPCVVSPVTSFQDALLATGFPHDRRGPDNNFDAFFAIKQRCQAVRRCGSAALDLCLVADGTYDGYWERKLNAWDLAGGAAIVRGAGGRVSDFEDGSRSVATGHVVATNGRIHAILLAELDRVHASRGGRR